MATDTRSASRLDPNAVILAARIPAIPDALQHIMDIANRPSTTSTQLEQLVLKDPSLCAQILKMVNSSFYALVQRVTSLNQAIILLGQSTVKSIAASLIMLETVGNTKNVTQYYLQRVWNRSVACSGMVTLLSKKEPLGFQQKIFLAALVHDIGHLILSAQFKDQYFKLVVKDEFPSPQAELQTIGTEHAEVGAALLKLWGFPMDLVELVRLHHTLDLSPTLQKEIDMLEAGDLLADLPRSGKSFNEVQELPQTNGFDRVAHLKMKLIAIGSSWEEVQEHESKIFLVGTPK